MTNFQLVQFKQNTIMNLNSTNRKISKLRTNSELIEKLVNL